MEPDNILVWSSYVPGYHTFEVVIRNGKGQVLSPGNWVPEEKGKPPSFQIPYPFATALKSALATKLALSQSQKKLLGKLMFEGNLMELAPVNTLSPTSWTEKLISRVLYWLHEKRCTRSIYSSRHF